MLTPQTDMLPPTQRVFETIGFAKVSTSGPEARRIGYLRAMDAITMNRDRLIADAKQRALERVREGYQRPIPRTAIPVGGANVRAALDLGVHLALRAGRISEHDAVIGRKLAWILAGGSLPHATMRRTIPAGSGARGVPRPVRRAEDAGADPAHAEDGKDAAKLNCCLS